MTQARQNVPRLVVPVPKHMDRLPRDKRGYIVPYFVQWFRDGKAASAGDKGAEPDFRVIDTQKFASCILKNLCWVCGGQLGAYRIHCIGPMCVINRITSEPAMHYPCAAYAVKVCPFILQPNMKRNLDYKDVEVVPPGGIHVIDNPGVMAMWTTKQKGTWKEVGGKEILLMLGEPEGVSWWTQGRLATYPEADLALVEGFAKLETIARKQDTSSAMVDLIRMYRVARTLLPKE